MLLAVIAGKVQIDPVEMLSLGVGGQHRTGTHRQARAYLDAAQFIASQRQRSIEGIGLAQRRAIVEPHP